MSNKHNNVNSNHLEEKRRLEKKKLLLQMENEINELEKKLKHPKRENTKIAALKSLKISLRFGQLIAPYAVVAGITISSASLIGLTPFHRDMQKQKAQMMKEFDSYGNIRYEQQYIAFENTEGLISYYGKWIKSTDGFYTRDVEVYSTNDITEDTIINLVNQNNINSLQEVLGKPILKQTEIKNNLNDEELSNEPYLQAIVYSELENDYIMVKESIDEDLSITLIIFLFNVLSDLIVWLWRDKKTNFKFRNCVKENAFA